MRLLEAARLAEAPEAESWRFCHSSWKPSSCSSKASWDASFKPRSVSFQAYDQGGYDQGYGADPGQGPPADYDADADEDPAAEEEKAEKEEVLNETLGKAKQVVDVLKRVDMETDASKAQLVEIGAKAIDFKARFRFRNAASAAARAHQLVSNPAEINRLLMRISEDAQRLQDMGDFIKVGKPYRFRTHLITLAGDAERAGQLMEGKVSKLKEALRVLKTAGGEFVDEELEERRARAARAAREKLAKRARRPLTCCRKFRRRPSEWKGNSMGWARTLAWAVMEWAGMGWTLPWAAAWVVWARVCTTPRCKWPTMPSRWR
ncbi:unnamed protein product [Effrenium voratum]|uniref:Uncharacterized protein n=1 Tax=Effrenium voratum TaxID=2562239 RepID=A0AA36JE62_9DINO|nr:unnamed protein product [Effrenium voratum]